MTPAPDPAAAAPATPSHPRVARLDPARLLDAVAEATGVRLGLLGRAPGGEVGAAFVRWPDGRDAVLTTAPPGAADQLALTGRALDRAREAGLPVPRYQATVPVPGATAVVQERLPGAPPRGVPSEGLVRALLEVVEACAGLLADLPELPAPEPYLTHDGPGFCLHGPLAAHSPRTRRLLDRIHRLGERPPPPGRPADDLVHLDLHPGNVLVADAAPVTAAATGGPAGGHRPLTGIIDWDGIGRGDRAFMAATLRFALDAAGAGRAATAPVDAYLDALPPDALLRYWATMSLRQVDWCIRHHGPAELDTALRTAESRIYEE